ncbi:MAG: PhoX family protein [Panacagrimonas sp.]
MSHHESQNTNRSNNPSFASILEKRFPRRDILRGGFAVAAASVFGGLGLAGCSDNDDDNNNNGGNATALGFAAVPKSLADVVSVPAGYTASVLYRLGDPIAAGVSDYSNDGTDDDFESRAGDHHDGLYYFGLSATDGKDPTSNSRGLLVMNHENITQAYLHEVEPSAAPRPEAEVRKEINCHGVSVIEVTRSAAGAWDYVQDSDFNRRITPFTPMDIRGPVRTSAFVSTPFSTTGTRVRGTVNNCANGFTPWGTYLTCEENWPFYFRRDAGDNANRSASDVAQLNRSGIAEGNAGNYAWTSVTGDDFRRWDLTVDTGGSATTDYRNEANGFGYVVEIDPYAPNSVPQKRTALGRFSHEGCWPAPAVAGQPLTFYSGDDNRGDYLYKFVSAENWNPADATAGLDAGDKYLDEGTLYVAKFNADGTGEWIALVQGTNGLTAAAAAFPFTTQAAVIVATRLAADTVGATRMDRPEWVAVNNTNGEVYMTLTNNSNRGINPAQPIDAANPRNYDAGTDSNVDLDGNVNGHIIRWREAGGLNAATTFTWDIFLFGARSSYPDAINVSKLDDSNDLSSPDGLWFSRTRNLVWIQTDDGAYTDTTNCMMLAAIPGTVGDGGSTTIGTQQTFVGKELGTDLRRFLVGPKECEITGIDSTPDGKTLFVNIQHPGEGGDPTDLTSTFPDGAGKRPRSATIVITKNDGGEVGF